MQTGCCRAAGRYGLSCNTTAWLHPLPFNKTTPAYFGNDTRGVRMVTSGNSSNPLCALPAPLPRHTRATRRRRRRALRGAAASCSSLWHGLSHPAAPTMPAVHARRYAVVQLNDSETNATCAVPANTFFPDQSQPSARSNQCLPPVARSISSNHLKKTPRAVHNNARQNILDFITRNQCLDADSSLAL